MSRSVKESAVQMDLHVPFSTILVIVGTATVLFVLYKIAAILLLLAMASLLAITLYPLLKRMRSKRIPGSGLIVTVGVLAVIGLAIVLIVPPMTEQASKLVSNFPQSQKEVMKHIPDHGAVHDLAEKFLKTPEEKSIEKWSNHVMTFGQAAVGGLSSVLLVLIFTLYLIVEGQQIFHWVTAFFSASQQTKLERTAKEVSELVFAYIAGQGITSIICAVYAFTVLSLLHVPAALTLGIIAGVFDVLPVLGFFISTIPAVLLAFTVSPTTALSVVALYILYHLIENYLLVPKIYGNRLRLSDFVVLMAVLVGGLVAGIPGAIIILPIVASYPTVERIWLVDYLGKRVINEHDQTERVKPKP